MGIKIPKQMGGFAVEGGGEAASTTKDFRGEEDCNYSCLRTFDFSVVRKAFSWCPFRDNDLPGRYKCTDNHTQTSVAVVEVTPSFHKFMYEYLTLLH